ncbi:hypothetical protein QYE76_062078 [Lolium multiflorum]|uniref:Reverse transcriptase zinc-binding domain-containing protein n=1 Tax=Lolium multiflorum TaxID=4521 RepID=A0AAD8S3C7_LOLMU|nr:hypothetical protein QYE76_062078 [Lolium multiflorum]
MAAVMEGSRTVDPLVVEELKSPGSVMLSTNVVMFYAPSDGKTKLLIFAREDLEHIYSTKEQGGPVVTSLAPYSVLPIQLQIDDMAANVSRSVAPLKCKILCWLARKKRLPTNEWRFRHQLSSSASCLSCSHGEDTDHLLLMCSQTWEVWNFFHRNFAARDFANFSDLWISR